MTKDELKSELRRLHHDCWESVDGEQYFDDERYTSESIKLISQFLRSIGHEDVAQIWFNE